MKNIESYQNDELGPLLEYPKTNNKTESNIPFKLVSDFSPAGDQPQAIRELVEGVNKGERSQILLGVPGSGKTFTTLGDEKNPDAGFVLKMLKKYSSPSTTRRFSRGLMVIFLNKIYIFFSL